MPFTQDYQETHTTLEGHATRLGFDYSVFSLEEREVIHEQEDVIRRFLGRETDNIYAIGERLHLVRNMMKRRGVCQRSNSF